MSRLAAEDAEAISARMRELRAYHGRQCFGRLGLGATNCWCFKAAENGDSLPCPALEAADVE
ncbi:MAG: hypothetical protein ACREFH_12720 [Stellaceae bacterium]